MFPGGLFPRERNNSGSVDGGADVAVARAALERATHQREHGGEPPQPVEAIEQWLAPAKCRSVAAR